MFSLSWPIIISNDFLRQKRCFSNCPTICDYYLAGWHISISRTWHLCRNKNIKTKKQRMKRHTFMVKCPFFLPFYHKYNCYNFCYVSRPLFTRLTDVIPHDLLKSRSHEIRIQTFPIALKFDRHLDSSAAERPDKFQSSTIIMRSNLAAVRLREIWWIGALDYKCALGYTFAIAALRALLVINDHTITSLDCT